MLVIEARNVQYALFEGLNLLSTWGRPRSSRNGDVLVADSPVMTEYKAPRERVLFWPAREANPFFHLAEALWMLNGGNDVASMAWYVKHMAEFSDDGKTFHGAYGYRWLYKFHFDQLEMIIRRLVEGPEDRRCVLQMWDAHLDLNATSKDVPCNTHVYFTRNWHGALDMTVCCRSNDIIWGAYGANAVHFSMLQEFMAAGIGCAVGSYWQLSNNFHAYRKVFDPLLAAYNRDQLDMSLVGDQYHKRVCPYPLVSTDLKSWRLDLYAFITNYPNRPFIDPFFTEVAMPMRQAHKLYKDGDLEGAIDIAGTICAQDWTVACCEWLERRLARREKK